MCFVNTIEDPLYLATIICIKLTHIVWTCIRFPIDVSNCIVINFSAMKTNLSKIHIYNGQVQ